MFKSDAVSTDVDAFLWRDLERCTVGRQRCKQECKEKHKNIQKNKNIFHMQPLTAPHTTSRRWDDSKVAIRIIWQSSLTFLFKETGTKQSPDTRADPTRSHFILIHARFPHAGTSA